MTDLPEGWAQSTLGDIAETALGKMLDRTRTRGLPPIPYLRNVNVQWGRIDIHDVLTMEMDSDEQEYFRLQPGDLMVCEGGEVGRCAIWQAPVEYMAFQKALHRVRLKEGIEPRFIRYFLEHQTFSGVLATFTTGTTIKHLPQQQFRLLPLALPPRAEQRRIVEALDDHLSRLEPPPHCSKLRVGGSPPRDSA